MNARTLLVGLLLFGLVATGPAAALPDYYNNSTVTTDTGQDAWVDGNTDGSLDSIISMFMRLPGYVIGPGPAAPGSVGASGIVLFGLLIGGALVGSTVGASLGVVAAGVLSVIGVFAVTSLGYIPQWGYGLVVFGVGILMYQGIRRMIE